MPPKFESRFLPDFMDCCPDDYENLLATNRFYYRVFNKSAGNNPKRSGFVARKYARQSSSKLDNLGADLLEDIYAVPNQIDWYNRSPTGWISATSEWAWAVWELLRRSHNQWGGRAEVAIIDSHALCRPGEQSGETQHFYTTDLLNRLLKEKIPIEKKLIDFANASAEVLFHGWIPARAIVSVLTLDEIVPSLPRYMIHDSVETGLSWANKPGFRNFRGANHDYFRSTHTYKQNWLEDHGAACGALACLFLDTMILEVTDTVLRMSSGVVETTLPTIAHIRGKAITPYSGADLSVLPTRNSFIGEQRRSRMLNQVPAPATQATQPASTRDMSISERPLSPPIPEGVPGHESFHGCMGDLAFMQLMQWSRSKLRILLDLNEKISTRPSKPASDVELGSINGVDTAGRSVSASPAVPNWVIEARVAIERLRGTILDLANAIAHWLVVSFPRAEWLEIKEGIEGVVKERLKGLEEMVEPHELPGRSTAGPVTKEKFNFENGKYPKVEMKYC